jgi:hypothetical protein
MKTQKKTYVVEPQKLMLAEQSLQTKTPETRKPKPELKRGKMPTRFRPIRDRRVFSGIG